MEAEPEEMELDEETRAIAALAEAACDEELLEGELEGEKFVRLASC